MEAEAADAPAQEQPADASAPEVGNAEVPEAAAPAAPAEEAAPASSGEGNDGAAPLEGEGQEGAGYDAHKEPGTGPEPEDGQFREAMATEGEAAEGEAGQEATDLGEEGGEGADTSTAPDQSAVLAVKAAPPPEPELEPLPEDYVPVAQLPTLPEPYARNEGGKPIPLAGVESLFLTGTTLEIVGLAGMGKATGVLQLEVPKEKLLGDVQFRGAISDFHPFKQKLMGADYDPLIFRINEDDIYGDGNNFEVAVSQSAADAWAFIEVERQRREDLLKLEAAHVAAEKRKPKSKRVIKAKPWESLGSEADIDEMAVKAKRDRIRLIVQRRRQDFNASFKLGDKDAHELWNSSQMECRPFKDPNFDLRRMEQDAGVQAVSAVAESGVQAGAMPLAKRPAAVQYAPLELIPEGNEGRAGTHGVADFLERVRDRCEVALLQNEIANIFQDDLAALGEDGEGGGGGGRKDVLVTEAQSFTHLTYSKNKVVSAIHWLPHRKGCVAVSCTEPHSAPERVTRAGRSQNAFVLVWNFKDPIHPEYVMMSPFEVFAFQYNPSNPDLIAGGCFNGQVVVWDLSSEHERIAKHKGSAGDSSSSTAAPGAAAGSGDSEEAAHIAVVRHKFMSDTALGHNTVISDLQWLPGVEINSRGRVTKHGEGSRECNFFATIAGDGKVNFWDVRIEKLLKKGKRADDLLDLSWKPVHSVSLISLIGLDLGGTRFCFNQQALEGGLFMVGSFDGELLSANFVRPEGDENTDDVRSCLQAHVGPIIALERSPFFPDVLLSVGDWQFQLWKEGGAAPLFQSGYSDEYYTAACWSPTRPGVIYLADQAGMLQVWDLLDRSHEASLKVTIAATPITSLSFNTPALHGHGMGGGLNTQQAAAQQLLAAGDATGVLRILELPRSLRRAPPAERKVMAAWLERSEARGADVEARVPLRTAAQKAAEEHQKELEAAAAAEAAALEAAAKDAAAAAAAGLPPPPAERKKGAVIEVDEKAEAEYLKLEHRFKVQLGLVEEAATA